MPLNPQDQQVIVDAHNAYRSDPAINAPNIQWDSTLATGAQTWVDNLATNVHQLQHSNPSMRQGLGENIAQATTGSQTTAQMVDLWGKTVVPAPPTPGGRSEQAQFKPGIFPNVSKDGGPVGHYTQVIWKTTTKVGCGLATDSTTGNTYLVCRYSPQGNMAGVGVPPPQPVSLVQVSVADATTAVGVDAANNVYYYMSPDNGTTWAPQYQMSDSRQMKQVSAASDYTVCGLDPNGVIWQGSFASSPFTWTQMAAGPIAFKYVSCGSATNIWAVGNDNSIWQYTSSWTRISGALKQVSAASDGTVWGLSPNSVVFKYTGNGNWSQIVGGYFAQISVGSATNIWGVNSETSTIWTYNVTYWDQRGGSPTKQISAASDGTLWGVNPNNSVFQCAATGARTPIVV